MGVREQHVKEVSLGEGDRLTHGHMHLGIIMGSELPLGVGLHQWGLVKQT